MKLKRAKYHAVDDNKYYVVRIFQASNCSSTSSYTQPNCSVANNTILYFTEKSSMPFPQNARVKIIKMKVVVFFAAICIFALVMPQAYAEKKEDEAAVREVRMAGKGV